MNYNMKKLYSLLNTDDPKKANLYIKKEPNGWMDFATYFNSFSVAKWKKYTSITSVCLKINLTGKWKIRWVKIKTTHESYSKEEEISSSQMAEFRFSADELSEDILGFQLMPLSDDACFEGGAWYGSFSSWDDKTIGIGICTYKREEYVNRTIKVLRDFQKSAPWLYVLVVDNGNTLALQKEQHFQILHNPNYGGSGGFTRAMIEYVNAGSVSHILLMDDDIVLEPGALERTWSLICALREEYKNCFLSGAMLSMEQPTIQNENTAYWNKIISKVMFKDFDLTNRKNLAINGVRPHHVNDYAGWWYCLIPVHRVKAIGYPLPAFIKSDDMEYGIRNGKELISLNGIGVWHEVFEKKLNPAMRFFSDRNTFILNHYAHDTGRFSLLASIFVRICKRILKGEFSRLKVLEMALREYQKGFPELTKIDAVQYFSNVRQEVTQPVDYRDILNIIKLIIKSISQYAYTQKNYMDFREQNLKTDDFWKKYLGLSGEKN